MNHQLLAVVTKNSVVLFYVLQVLATRKIILISEDENNKLFNRKGLIYIGPDEIVHKVGPSSEFLEPSRNNPAAISLLEYRKIFKNMRV